MRMNGSWHIYRPGERWQRPRRDMRDLVATADFEAVGFNIPVAEFIVRDRADATPRAAPARAGRAGDEFDPAKALANLHARADTSRSPTRSSISACSRASGNVYKSEVLFMCGVNPFARVGDLTRSAARLDRRNRSARPAR